MALRREAAVLEQTEVVVLSVDVPADLYLELQQAPCKERNHDEYAKKGTIQQHVIDT